MTERTLLLIEDEPDILMSLRLALELAGYRVIEAASAEEGLAVLDRETPEAILLDIALPGMDGWAFLERVRQSTSTRALPVIVISAHAGLATSDRAAQLGCRAVLTKPFPIGALTESLESIFSNR